MRRSSIGKTLAANRQRKTPIGSKVMPGIKSMSSMQTAVPGGTSAAMKKGGVAKKGKGKVGVAIIVAIGKKKDKK